MQNGVRSAERETRNGFTTLRCAHKERIKRGTRSAELPCSAELRKQGNEFNAERGARSTERPHSANAPLTMKIIIFLSV